MRVNQPTSNQIQRPETSRGGQAAETGRAGSATETAAKGAARPAPTLDPADAVKTDISSKSRDFAAAKAIASNAPDVREDKIAELRRRIADKSYNVDADRIADRMVDEHLKMSGMS